jgi:hypothetical protein
MYACHSVELFPVVVIDESFVAFSKNMRMFECVMLVCEITLMS